MIRALILVLLIGGLAFYVHTERKRNYPLDSVSTPSGRSFNAIQLPDECSMAACMHRVAYLTKLRDTSAIRDEAQALLPWLDPRIKDSRPPHVVGILAIEPGFMRMTAPKRVVALTFAMLVPGSWTYLEQQDVTTQMVGVFKDK
jgi:hypothetical protein